MDEFGLRNRFGRRMVLAVIIGCSTTTGLADQTASIRGPVESANSPTFRSLLARGFRASPTPTSSAPPQPTGKPCAKLQPLHLQVTTAPELILFEQQDEAAQSPVALLPKDSVADELSEPFLPASRARRVANSDGFRMLAIDCLEPEAPTATAARSSESPPLSEPDLKDSRLSLRSLLQWSRR